MAGAMYRNIPVSSKACAERVRKRNYQKHKDRMDAIRPQIDNAPPRVMYLDHLRVNLKREQLEEDRYQKIDRENNLLLQKMSDIMKHPSHSAPRAQSGPPSLNRDARKMDLMRITQQNQKILQRIQRAQPVYNHVEWEHAHHRNNALVRNACEYPPPLMKRKLSPLGATSGSASSGKFGIEDDLALPDGGGGGRGRDPELKCVLKNGRTIGQHYYLLEMATDGRMLAVSAYDGDEKTTLELLVNEKNHRRLFNSCNGDYSLIANKLRVEEDGDDRKLVLDMGGSAFEPGGIDRAAVTA